MYLLIYLSMPLLNVFLNSALSFECEPQADLREEMATHQTRGRRYIIC